MGFIVGILVIFALVAAIFGEKTAQGCFWEFLIVLVAIAVIVLGPLVWAFIR